MSDSNLLSDQVVPTKDAFAERGTCHACVAKSTPGPEEPTLHDSPDAAFRGTMLHKFVARGVDQAAALERAHRSGNAAELVRGAQTLKRLAADLSADVLLEWADELERTAGRGDLGEAGSALVRTQAEIARCVEAADQLLGRWASE